MAEEYKKSITSTSDMRNKPTDKNMDNLARGKDWRSVLPNGIFRYVHLV